LKWKNESQIMRGGQITRIRSELGINQSITIAKNP
jgi:hypothetical protein